MKSKKLPLLIALVALIGTVTAFVPQQTSADIEDDSFCLLRIGLPDGTPTPQNDDDHGPLGIERTGDRIDVTVDYRLLLPDGELDPDNDPITNAVEFFLVNVDLPDNDPDKVTRDLVIDETASNPKMFMGVFDNVAQGNYEVFACGEEVRSDKNTDPDEGLHHTNSGEIVFDEEDPVGECGDPDPFEVVLDDGETDIDKGDTRLSLFFSGVSFTDNLDDELDFDNDAPDTFFPGDTPVEFGAADDANNRGTVVCTLRVTGGEIAGCKGVQLDTEGVPTELEFCIEIPVNEPECTLGILGAEPVTLRYGDVEQNEVSLVQLLQIKNEGNAPGLIKVFGEFWTDAERTTDPDTGDVIARMLSTATHFSLVDPNTIIQSELQTFYDDPNRSFPLTEDPIPGKKIIIPILEGDETRDTHWLMRIDLLDDTFFGNLRQTMTFELQQCSEANLCETLGFPCPESGDLFEGNGFGR